MSASLYGTDWCKHETPLTAGAAVQRADKEGWTALLVASGRCFTAAVLHLIAAIADVSLTETKTVQLCM